MLLKRLRLHVQIRTPFGAVPSYSSHWDGHLGTASPPLPVPRVGCASLACLPAWWPACACAAWPCLPSPGLPAALPAGVLAGGGFGLAHVLGFRLRSLSDREARRPREHRELHLRRTRCGMEGRPVLAPIGRPSPGNHHTPVGWVRTGGRGPPPVWGQWDPENPPRKEMGWWGLVGPPRGFR